VPVKKGKEERILFSGVGCLRERRDSPLRGGNMYDEHHGTVEEGLPQNSFEASA
jgi:hypothetical protein